MNCYDDGFRTQSPLTASYRILERAVGQFASLATSSQDDEGSVTRATQIMVAADLEDRPVLDGATEGAAGVIRNLEGLAVLAALSAFRFFSSSFFSITPYNTDSKH